VSAGDRRQMPHPQPPVLVFTHTHSHTHVESKDQQIGGDNRCVCVCARARDGEGRGGEGKGGGNARSLYSMLHEARLPRRWFSRSPIGMSAYLHQLPPPPQTTNDKSWRAPDAVSLSAAQPCSSGLGGVAANEAGGESPLG